MAALVLTILFLALSFYATYWLAGWVLAFLVVAQTALIKYAVLVILGCVALGIAFGSSNRGNRWWAYMFIGILFCVGLEQLEPHVAVVRVVIATLCAIWATYSLYRPVIRPLAQRFHQQRTNP